MAIVKKNGCGLSNGAPARRSAGKPAGNGCSFPGTPSESSSNSEPDEPIDAHVHQVGDQVCELPPELVDIPDLTHILSLETWNSVLTEDDRERLVTLLPSMDESAYGSTLRQLFTGENFYFSSPLADLLQLLRSGQCHPKASRYQDALSFLHRREHYHQLRKYHNGMVNSLLEMQQLWQVHPDSNMEERGEMWRTWQAKKIRLTPQFFIEKKTGPLQNYQVQRLLKRKEKFINKEVAKTSQLTPLCTASRDGDYKVTGPSRQGRKLRKGDCTMNSIYAKLPGKVKRPPHPKGVLRLLPKANIEASMPHALNQKPEAGDNEDKIIASSTAPEATISPILGWSSASPVKEKTAFKIKLENRTKATGLEKPNTVFIEEEMEKDSPEIEMETESARHSVDASSEATCHEMVRVKGSLNAAEPLQLYSSGLDMQSINESKKKVRKKFKDMKSPDPGNGGVNMIEINCIADTVLARKEVEDILDDKEEGDADDKLAKRNWKRFKSANDTSFIHPCTLNGEVTFSGNISPVKTIKRSPSVPPIALSFPFSIVHLLSAVRSALTSSSGHQSPTLHSENMHQETSSNQEDILSTSKTEALQVNDGFDVTKQQEERKLGRPPVALQEIVKWVQANPGDYRILQTQEPLQGLVRGALKVLSSKTAQPGMKGWKPLVMYIKVARGWSWIGPLSPSPSNAENSGVQMSHDTWFIPQKTVYKLQESFCNWFKHEQEILQQLGQLALALPSTTPTFLDEKERFRELRAQKSLITISPTSEEMRAYFRKEEVLRYSVPDRSFSYTCLDGRKSAVAPLRRVGGKPNSKARDHFMLKPDRPPHVTILCLVRDAAARLPGSIGTRADVCSLIRDSQYIVEEVSDAQLNQVVSGALDRLHYERDPCVRFDGDRKLWVYLHTDKDDEDFEDDATSSTKRWRRTKKEGVESSEFCLTQEYDFSGREDQDSGGLGLDFSPTDYFGGPSDLSSVYSSAGRSELLYTRPLGSLTSPLVLDSAFSGSGREDTSLPFIELPPSIQPPCVNMQQSHPMGWEVLSNRWQQDHHFQFQDPIIQEVYGVASLPSSHKESEVVIDRGI